MGDDSNKVFPLTVQEVRSASKVLLIDRLCVSST